MLHLFRRTGVQDGVPIDGVTGGVAVSHILAKFLKRLRQMEKPCLLDLGRLSGSNIEFFAQRGCKVHVEDLLFSLAAAPAAGPGGDPVAAPGTGDDAPAERGIARATDGVPATPAPPAAAAPARAGPPGGPAAAARPAGGASSGPPARAGGRPSRRIVLPPRTFASSASARTHPDARPAPARAGAAGQWATVRNAGLPTQFDYPDETFQAIVAWDICNFYSPAAMRLLAAEARRILKPGGLLLGYFHARRPDGPDTPRRYRILDETHVACDEQAGPPLQRQVYQNRDIEKMFTGLSIVELYFLKNATREILMEKKTARAAGAGTPVRPATPRARFTIE
ncbi:MAG TPA: class I SAM-dependent methyltransferase [Candidatus Dormibacteraeota bacterium]|nr:class I SAM-dependent methyltransferase [Candidatus Dormibacteraeota bacterium]